MPTYTTRIPRTYTHILHRESATTMAGLCHIECVCLAAKYG